MPPGPSPRATGRGKCAGAYQSPSRRSRNAPLGEPGVVVVVVLGGQGVGVQVAEPEGIPPCAVHWLVSPTEMQVSKAPDADYCTQHATAPAVGAGTAATGSASAGAVPQPFSSSPFA